MSRRRDDERTRLEAEIAAARRSRHAGEVALETVQGMGRAWRNSIVEARTTDTFGDELTVSFTLRKKQ